MPTNEERIDAYNHLLKMQNARQKVFYNLHNAKILADKREKYRLKRIALGKNPVSYKTTAQKAIQQAQAVHEHEEQAQEQYEQEQYEQEEPEEQPEAPQYTLNHKGQKIAIIKPFDKNAQYKTYDDICSKMGITDKTEKSHLNTVFKMLKQPKNYLDTIQHAQPVIDCFDDYKYKGQPYASNSLKSYMQILLKSIDILTLPIEPDERALYQDYFEIKTVESNSVSKHKQANIQIFTFKVYCQKISKLYGQMSKQYIISRLYWECPVRDDFHLKLIETEGENSKDIKDQYLVVPKSKDKQIIVIINHYKTDKRYPIIRVKLSGPLSNLIRKYITTTKIPMGDYLFGPTEHNSAMVSEMNRNIGLEDVGGTNVFRNMACSELEFASPAEQLKLAKKMGHSPLMNLVYIRKIKEDPKPKKK